jgi:hypothetical protein
MMHVTLRDIICYAGGFVIGIFFGTVARKMATDKIDISEHVSAGMENGKEGKMRKARSGTR